MSGGFEDRITEGREVGTGLFAGTVWQEMAKKEPEERVKRSKAAGSSTEKNCERQMQQGFAWWYLLLGLAAGVAIQLCHWELQAFPSQVFIHRHHTCEVWRAAECIRPCLQQRQPHSTKSQGIQLFFRIESRPRMSNICQFINAYSWYLNYTEHSVMNHQRGVVSWDD